MRQNSTKRIADNLRALSVFGGNEQNGITRLPFSKEARACADYLKQIMQEIGLRVWEDVAGNVWGELVGEDVDAQAILLGSHYDTVYNGGAYDGIAGVVCAIEVVRLLCEGKQKPKSTIRVVAFNEEEGVRFGVGYIGSAAMLGQITVQYLKEALDRDGISAYQAIEAYGNNPENIGSAAIDMKKVRAFFEVHIEQGPVLDKLGIELGVVECIVGIQRYEITITGRADHAGTTPMDMRLDALVAAAKVIGSIPESAIKHEDGSVATVGCMKVLPGGVNIVPQTVEFSVDLRSRNNNSIDAMAKDLLDSLEAVTKSMGLSYHVETKHKGLPVYLNPALLDMLEDSCKQKGYTYKRMLSGAGHDSQAIAEYVDTVMLFVPSKDGRSHSPLEHSEYDDLAKASEVLLDVLQKMVY